MKFVYILVLYISLTVSDILPHPPLLFIITVNFVNWHILKTQKALENFMLTKLTFYLVCRL